MKEQKHIVFSHPKAGDVASDYIIRHELDTGEIDWNKFPDGTPNLFMRRVETDVNGREIINFMSLKYAKDFFAQLGALYAFPHYGASSLRTVLTDFPVFEKSVEYLLLKKSISYLLSLIPNSDDGRITLNTDLERPLELGKVDLEGIVRSGKVYTFDMNRVPSSRRKDTNAKVIMYHHSMKQQAQDLAEKTGIPLVEIGWEYFERGWPKVIMPNEGEYFDKEIYFLSSLQGDVADIEQMVTWYALSEAPIKGLNILLGYFPYGTMERISKRGEVATAATAFRMLSSLPQIRGHNNARRPVKVYITDIHALQEEFFAGDGIKLKLLSAMDDFKLRLAQYVLDNYGISENLEEKIAICFPDEGALKRFGDMFPGFKKIVCEKRRMGKDNQDKIVTIKEGEEYIKGMIVVLVDDLIQTGGTNIKCANAIYPYEPLEIIVVSTHGVFPRESYMKFQESKIIGCTMISDSCPLIVDEVDNLDKFNVVTLNDMYAKIINGE